MDERGLGIFQLARNVSREPEVWILIDGAGDETGDLGCLSSVGTED